MDSLYLFQFACLNFMVINALVIGITHYYARWRNRRYEQSRWMLFAAFTVLAVQYFVQMRYGFRAAGDDKGAAVNLLFYAPSFTFIAMSIYNLGGVPTPGVSYYTGSAASRMQPSSPSTASTTISTTVCLWADGSTS